MATPHMIAGAAIGKVVRPPWLALAAAFASHSLLDIVPHLDSGAFFEEPAPTLVAVTALDVLIGASVVLFAAHRAPRRRAMVWAAFFAVVIDLVDNVPPWNAWFHAWPTGAWINSFHHGTQHSVAPDQWPLGVATQIAVLALALWVLRRAHTRVACREGVTAS